MSENVSEVVGWIAQRRRWLLIGIISAAIAVRLVAAFALGDTAEPVSGAFDQVSYDALAQRVLEGHGFSFATPWYPFTEADEPTAHWSYLYTAYLSAVYAIFGQHPLAARLTQVVLSGLSIGLTYQLAARVSRRMPIRGERTAWRPGTNDSGAATASPIDALSDDSNNKLSNSSAYRASTVGLAAAALAAFYAYFIFFNAALMTQTFYIIALLAALNLAIDLPSGPSAARWLGLGLTLGVGTLLRQTLLVFAPVLLVWIWWASRGANRPPYDGRRVAPASGVALCLLVVALTILPWTLYNATVFHDFLLLNSNGGYWLYASNHPNQGTTFDANYVAPLPDDLEGLSEPAIDRALYQRGLGFIVADPGRFVLLSFSRVGAYFWVLPSGESLTISNLARFLSFGLYLPFMLCGLWLSRRHWRVCLPLYLYVAFDTTLHLATWAAPRYRLPSDAVLMVFAGWALADLGARVAAKLRAPAPAGQSPAETARALPPAESG